jgi:O-antigen ligase
VTTAVETEPPSLASATAWARRAVGWRLDAHLLQKLGAFSVAALPALLTLYLSFNSGGFFASATGVAVAVLAGTVALRMALVRDAFGGFSRPLLIAVGALAVYSLWSLISMRWSHSPSRALDDFDLANVYLFALILFGSFARTHRRVRWIVILTWLAMLAVCLSGLATRLRPDLFHISANGEGRLWFPMTYTDALGLFATCGMLLAAYLASSSREPAALRILGTAAIPVFAVTVLLTYSRAALLLAPLALIAYVLLAQPRGVVSALLAAGPATAYVLIRTYQANLISNGATSAAAVQQGRALTTSIVLACAAAAAARTVLLKLDTHLGRVNVPTWRRWNRAIACGCCLGGIAIVGLTGIRSQISHQWGTFSQQSTAFVTSDVRYRASHINVSLAERLPNWRIALRVFDENPLRGDGAGMFGTDWYRLRPNQEVSLQTHSLYLEAMSELGVVGLAALLLVVVIVVGAGFVRARRRSSRSLWVVIGLVGLVWAIDAGFDWDWEMPALTLPVFVLGGCALARRGSGARLQPRTELLLRVGISLIAVAVAVTASGIAVSDAQAGRGVRAFNNGNCSAAVADARASTAAMSSLPQPYAILGYCDIESGSGARAVAEMTKAVHRDPENWLYYYGLAFADASARRDPHPAIRQAQVLNPLEPMIQSLAMKLKGNNPRRWQEVGEIPQMSLQQ